MNLEKCLEEVTAAPYDLEKAKAIFKKRELEAAKNIHLSKVYGKLLALIG